MEQGINGMTDVELIHSLLDTERELIGSRIRHSMNQLENTAGLKVLRKSIAQFHTEARRREIDQGLRKDTLLHAHRRSYQAGTASAGEGDAEKGGFLSGIVDKLSAQE
jgi:ribosomal protein L29